MTVAAALATTSTATSSRRDGWAIEAVEHGQRAAGQPQRQQVDQRPGCVLAQQPVAAADAEAEAAVGLGVGDRGQCQRDGVGRHGAERATCQQVERGVGDRRHHADEQEASHRVGQQQPHHPTQVGQRGAEDVHPGVGVVDPVDGHLVDAHPLALGQDQQLGVEEPALILRPAPAAGGRRRPGSP